MQLRHDQCPASRRTTKYKTQEGIVRNNEDQDHRLGDIAAGAITRS